MRYKQTQPQKLYQLLAVLVGSAIPAELSVWACYTLSSAPTNPTLQGSNISCSTAATHTIALIAYASGWQHKQRGVKHAHVGAAATNC